MEYLEKCQETVQFLLLCPAIKAHPTRIEKHTNESDAEEIIRHIENARLAWQRSTISYGHVQSSPRVNSRTKKNAR
jgi:hypothetical protein